LCISNQHVRKRGDLRMCIGRRVVLGGTPVYQNECTVRKEPVKDGSRKNEQDTINSKLAELTADRPWRVRQRECLLR
jgi:hypothetical protein